MFLADSLAERAAAALKALAALVVAFFRMLFGGVKEAGAMLVSDARRMAKAAKTVGEATGRVVGRTLDGPARALDLTANAFGQTLGALLPQAPVGPKQVADAAVASDDGLTQAALPAADIHGSMFRAAAESLRHGGPHALRKFSPYVPEFVQQWLVSLEPRDLDVAIRLDPAVLVRHAQAERLSDTTPLLPPPLHLQPKADADADFDAMVARARRNFAGSRNEAAALGRRGPRPQPPRPYDDGPGFDPGPRPSFH